jgi:selenocysteine-specific elongation factor
LPANGQVTAPLSRFAIVGTAGHIDHGKTSLVEALTGKNTDRLKEEKERGISIDIDFAPLSYADGTLIGLVDVPGHERFVRNMVAGAAGIDAALLVIDANEGPRQQTFEHIAILQVLGIRHAVVALAKCDTVDGEWLEIAVEVVREALAKTPFAGAPIIPTSAKTRAGIDDLKAALHDLVKTLPPRDVRGAFRLPIDRVFSVPGHGTVVTGTVWRGQVSVGDALDLLPDRRPVRVRGIQVHGRPQTTAYAGQRAALNITGVSVADVRRGCVVCGEQTLFESRLLDAQVAVVDAYPRPLRHRERVHVHLGTAETVGRVLLLECDELAPGSTSFAQLLLDKPLVCEAGDHFVLRSYSPVTTMGGGVVVDAAPPRLHRRKRPEILAQLQGKQAGTPLERLARMGEQGDPITVDRVVAAFGVTRAEAEEMLREAEHKGLLLPLPGGWYSATAIESALRTLDETLQELHRKHRFLPRLPRALLTGACPRLSARDVDWLLQEGAQRGLWQLEQAFVCRTGWRVQLSEAEQDMLDRMLSTLESRGLAGMTEAELTAQFPRRDRVAAALLKYAESEGWVVPLEPQWFIAGSTFADAMQAVYVLYEQQGPFTVAAVRDALQTSRKVAVALLEYTDRLKWTERRGDVRVFRQPWPPADRSRHNSDHNVTDS